MPGRTSSSASIVPVPGPHPLPIVGNLFDIDPDASTQSLLRLADEYGPIFRMTFAGESAVIINSVALLDEACDESRFHKLVIAGVQKLRAGVHDGLFTANEGEHNWDLAHRILLPVFGPTKIREMINPMKDLAHQLRLKWARYGPSYPIHITQDLTRLTLDTIALCGMGYRFNSFYRDKELHPFITSMILFLRDSDLQSQRPDFWNSMNLSGKKKYGSAIKNMRQVCEDILQERKTNPSDSDDLLNALLYKTDPKTGEKLPDSSVIDNMITFLVAGHETTSGMLSFAFYYLLKDRAVMEKVREEVDQVIGAEDITVQHLSQLPYINAVLRETLRLMPTAPAFTVGSERKEILGKKYAIKAGEPIIALLGAIQQDKAVYGPDAAEWKPERMLDDRFKQLPANAWKPFGNGKRGCIGRAFAWQEAVLVVATLFQTFTFSMADPSYNLKVKETLTIKPDDFMVHAKIRHDSPSLSASALPMVESKPSRPPKSSSEYQPRSDGKPMTILYGSNTGTCESLAHRLARDAAQRGLNAQTVDSLDSAKEKFPQDHPVIIITASYDGYPPDNAKEFVDWIKSLSGNPFENASFAVFGCGHHDWVNSFYKVPQVIDERLEQLGAQRLTSCGVTDTADEDPFASLEEWENDLWRSLGAQTDSAYASSTSLDRLHVQYHPLHEIRRGYSEAIVSESRALTSPDAAPKLHLEIRMPPEISYEPGDSLAVLPTNPRQNVQRALSKYRLASDTMVKISSARPTALPTEFPVSAADLFSSYVELSQLATPKNVQALADAASDEATKEELNRMAGRAYASEVREKRLSVLDLLETFTSVDLSIESFLEMLPALRTRLYSVSSAPNWKPGTATITYSVLDVPKNSGSGHFLGAASNYLAELTPGAVMRVEGRKSKRAFRPPANAADRPIIMIAAGSGLSPFRGFIQQRDLERRQGKPLAPALVFFGCRGRHLDDLYRDELNAFEQDGVVTAYRAYSANQAHEDARGCRYVQDRVALEKERVLGLWKQGATVYICGFHRMAEAVKQTLFDLLCPEADRHDLASWLDGLESGRLVTEIFT